MRIFPKMYACKSLPLTRFACVHGGKHVANMHVSRTCTDCQVPHAHTHSKCCHIALWIRDMDRPCQILESTKSTKIRLFAKSRDFSDFGDSRLRPWIWPKSRFGAKMAGSGQSGEFGWILPEWLSGPIGACLARPAQTGRFGRICQKVDFLGSDLPNLAPGAYI